MLGERTTTARSVCVLSPKSANLTTHSQYASRASSPLVGLISHDLSFKMADYYQLADLVSYNTWLILSAGSSVRYLQPRLAVDKLKTKASAGTKRSDSFHESHLITGNYKTVPRAMKSVPVVKNPHLIAHNLKLHNYVLRTEDRGSRYVVCSTHWEHRQLSQLSSFCTQSMSPIELDVRRFWGRLDPDCLRFDLPILRFSPKTHKPGPVTGRPIVSWPKDSQPYATRIKLAINNWLRKHEITCGDIKQMFTMIPRDDFDEWLNSCEELQAVYPLVVCHFRRTMFLFHGKVYYMIQGIDMGSLISTHLARGWLCWRLMKLYERIPACVGIASYVDDLQVSVPSVDDRACMRIATSTSDFTIQDLKLRVQEAIAPLQIKWDTEFKFLDYEVKPGSKTTSFYRKGRVREKMPDPSVPGFQTINLYKSEILRWISRECVTDKQLLEIVSCSPDCHSYHKTLRVIRDQQQVDKANRLGRITTHAPSVTSARHYIRHQLNISATKRRQRNLPSSRRWICQL
ncbi:hypothetical protein HDV05_004418 [Chytridiales sp. JEL 0842]|nr:hypothetical protein HDV05_004418 [Chytridiales sp. JEL 0842]